VFLGIDTSNYTTSLAVVDIKGDLLEDRRKTLPVPEGERGLQQSKALFYHLQNIPELMEEVFTRIKGREILAVAASSRPRPQEGSYMPVFRAGTVLSGSVSALLQVPAVATSHQEGHVLAGLWSVQKQDLASCLVIHLSGGTTELLLVNRKRERPLRFEIKILGGSSDIQAGQLVDRVGTAMGLSFPCGPALEKLARESECYSEKERAKAAIPSFVKGLEMSFSGAETQAIAFLKKGIPPPLVARGVERCIAAAVEKAARRAVNDTGQKEVLLVGGVAANDFLRSHLRQKLEHRSVGARLLFPEVRFCGDNAVGVSLVARSALR
jgi:N6-L-threonylcarbamoyladenine synthase